MDKSLRSRLIIPAFLLMTMLGCKKQPSNNLPEPNIPSEPNVVSVDPYAGFDSNEVRVLKYFKKRSLRAMWMRVDDRPMIIQEVVREMLEKYPTLSPKMQSRVAADAENGLYFLKSYFRASNQHREYDKWEDWAAEYGLMAR